MLQLAEHSLQEDQSVQFPDGSFMTHDLVVYILPAQSIVGTHWNLLGMRVKDSWRLLHDKPGGRFGLTGEQDRI